MAENIVINEQVYNNVEGINVINTENQVVSYFKGSDLIDAHNTDENAHSNLFDNKANVNDLDNYVPKSRTINGKTLDENIDIEANDLTGILLTNKGGTGHNTIEDTVYTTARYRASALYTEANIVNPTINGVINWAYA